MTEINEKPKSDGVNSERKWKILVVILAVLLLLTGGTMIFGGGVPFFPAFAPNDGGSASQGIGLVVDPNAGEYVPKPLDPGVVIRGFGKLTIPPYTKEVTEINLYNPEENEGWYYLTFTLCLLDDNGEVSETLYESQLVPPGLYLQDITLSRGLAPGEYDAVMLVQPYRIADLSQTNAANLKFTIMVI
ncbi:MAG: hypothetical protein J6J70_05845 [Methanocorpusculaceae archaeon]|nr:hypothetical protein [Methanocorpusculaceae archaeon]